MNLQAAQLSAFAINTLGFFAPVVAAVLLWNDYRTLAYISIAALAILVLFSESLPLLALIGTMAGPALLIFALTESQIVAVLFGLGIGGVFHLISWQLHVAASRSSTEQELSMGSVGMVDPRGSLTESAPAQRLASDVIPAGEDLGRLFDAATRVQQFAKEEEEFWRSIEIIEGLSTGSRPQLPTNYYQKDALSIDRYRSVLRSALDVETDDLDGRDPDASGLTRLTRATDQLETVRPDDPRLDGLHIASSLYLLMRIRLYEAETEHVMMLNNHSLGQDEQVQMARRRRDAAEEKLLTVKYYLRIIWTDLEDSFTDVYQYLGLVTYHEYFFREPD